MQTNKKIQFQISSEMLKYILAVTIVLACQFGLTAQDNTADLSAVSPSGTTDGVKSGKSNGLYIDYNIIAEADISPLIVSKDVFALSLGGNVGFGVRFNERYLVGIIFGAGYYTLGALPSSILNGAELVFRWTIYGATRFTEWFNLYYGIGVSLCFSSYGISHLGYIPATSVGPVFRIEPRFYIPKFRYIDFALIVDADLRIGNYFTPTVYGGGRVNFHPYITWLSLFAEFGGRYERYQSQALCLDVGHFVLTAGISLDLFVGPKKGKPSHSKTDDKPHDKPSKVQQSDDNNPQTKTNDTPQKDIEPSTDKDKMKESEKPEEPEKEESIKEEKQVEPEKDKTSEEVKPDTAEVPSDENKEDKPVEQSAPDKTKLVSEMDDDTKAKYQELIDELEQQTGAKVVSFSDVLFEPNSDEMLEGSEATLDSVVAMLKENESMRLNLCGYTNNVGNKKQELKLSKKRVNKVVNYLVLKGIKMTRLEVAAYGGENVKRAGITIENRRVEIRVLEDK